MIIDRQKIVRKLTAVMDQREADACFRYLLEDLFEMKAPFNDEVHLTDLQADQFEDSITRLLNNEPLQYITRKAYFCDMILKVDPRVLIPRPETEELVYHILRDKSLPQAPKILDIGTGSGCIALALKKLIPNAKVTGIELSADALEIAWENAHNNDLDVDFIIGDMHDPELQAKLTGFDLIVSNPPYVLNSDKSQMDDRVVDHEPALALFVPDDDPMRSYLSIREIWLKNSAAILWLEIHEDLAETVMQLFENDEVEMQLFKDLQGKARMLKIA